ncbi:MAG: DUF4013 domain-containing protein [Planctomycetia bacterium]|nr:DUF4013 domain-containing protein [Planctomycetia bacterium]
MAHPIEPPPLPETLAATVLPSHPSPLYPVQTEPPPVAIPREAARPSVARRALGLVRRVLAALLSAADWLFGAAALVLGLAVLATLPVLQLLSLGYLLEASGRVARERRLTAGFVGVRKAARLGSIVLCTWLLLWPLRFVSAMASSARLIEPGGAAQRGWTIALWLLTALFMVHVVSACFRGGRVRSFLWPRPIYLARQLTRPGAYAKARDAVWDFVVRLRLPYYFWLGLRGFVGGLVWLAVPITLLAAGAKAPLVGVVGGLLLALVVLYLPFAQVRFAVENRLRAMFEVRALRNHFRRAPVAFLIALVATLVFALPLYLLKIEIIPREAAWLPSLVFVAFIFPARLLAGWAYARAERRERPRHWLFRIPARLAMLPVAVVYVAIVYFTQFTSWHGIASLYEQHAFLVPVPFLGL